MHVGCTEGLGFREAAGDCEDDGSSTHGRTKNVPLRVRCCSPTAPPPPYPSNTYVQATLGVGAVNFHIVDFGGAIFNWSYTVLCAV